MAYKYIAKDGSVDVDGFLHDLIQDTLDDADEIADYLDKNKDAIDQEEYHNHLGRIKILLSNLKTYDEVVAKYYWQDLKQRLATNKG